MPRSSSTTKAGAALRTVALGLPQTHEEFPWGERALKVRKKVFLFLHYDVERLSLSVKLPASHGAALMFSFATPTGYGLGRAGWVTARFEKSARPPVRLLTEWLVESYRAVAPARLAAEMEAPTRSPRTRHPAGKSHRNAKARGNSRL
jgi:predicted DNA-binding protein (MmcQ/YjbR family)